MAEVKTKPTKMSAKKFLESIAPEEKHTDSLEIHKLMKQITGKPAKMWGTSIVGYGMYHYKSERSTQEGDWPLIGFSPRKQNLTLYIMPGMSDIGDLLKKLGKHKISKGCLYIKRLSEVDRTVLEKIIHKSYAKMKKEYGGKQK